MIKHFQRTLEIQKYLKELNQNQHSIGLVPTMGNLHEGHLSLLEKSIKENDLTIITIFVNPKQFGEGEDYKEYPRTLNQDMEKIKSVSNKNVIIFSPISEKEIYPTASLTKISVPSLENKLCGLNRPGHFEGVCGVVYRLFNILRPNTAYFGEKDFQQLLIIKEMARDLFPNLKIKSLPIIRDKKGLAKSSRNSFLNERDYLKALHLPQAINEIKRSLTTGDKPVSDIKKSIKKKVEENKEWDYLELLDANDLSSITSKTTKYLIAGALKVGTVRLIDNQVINIGDRRV